MCGRRTMKDEPVTFELQNISGSTEPEWPASDSPIGTQTKDGNAIWQKVGVDPSGVMFCACCNEPIPLYKWEDGVLYTGKDTARISRGKMPLPENGEFAGQPYPPPDGEDIKFERFICSKCFMTDPDLCAFFNKIGCQVR